MLDVSARSGGRLPELFAGIAREDVAVPVAYPTSCSPQAWAAATPLMFLRGLLRLDPGMLHHRVWCAPRLPEDMERFSIEGIPLAGRRVSVRVEGDDWELEGLGAGIELVREPRAPLTAAS